MNNVIQLADARRAKLDKIRRAHGAGEAQICLYIADWYYCSPAPVRARVIELVLAHCKEPEYARQALREQWEAI